MGEAIQRLQGLLDEPTTGVFDHSTASALWAAWKRGAISAGEPAVLEARTEACLAYGPPPANAPAPGTAIMVDGRWRPLPADVPLWVVPHHMYELHHISRRAKPVQVILHHDVCGSAQACFRALKGVQLSTHLACDDNGIVLQFLDLFTDVAWHAMGHVRLEDGSMREHGFNMRSVGFDLSNPVLPDSRDGQADADRGLLAERVHGRNLTELAYYPCQIEAALETLKVVRREIPGIGGSYRVDAEWKGDLTGNTPGMFGHYHVNARKMDPFGFPMRRLAEVVG